MHERELFALRISWSTSGSHALAANDPVARLLRALPHPHPQEGTPRGREPDLAIEIHAGSTEMVRPEGYRASFHHGQMQAFERDGEFVLVAPGSRILVARDGTRIHAVVDPASMMETAFADTTLFVALCIALRRRGLFHMHAGAAERGDGTRVLVIGDSGAGKSTVTLSLLGPGAKYLGDDALFLTRGDSGATLLGFPRPFHLGPATVAAFPALGAEGIVEPNGGKRAVPFTALPGTAAARMGPPHVVLFPRIVRAPVTELTPLSSADAFGQALRSSALLVVDGMGDAAAQLAVLRDLLADARAYEVHLGADWLDDPQGAAARLPLTRDR